MKMKLFPNGAKDAVRAMRSMHDATGVPAKRPVTMTSEMLPVAPITRRRTIAVPC